MAHSYISLAQSGYISWKDAMETSRMLLDKALALNERLSEAHALLAELALMGDEPFEVMESEARKAIEINPNLAEGHRHARLRCPGCSGNRRSGSASSRRRTSWTRCPTSVVERLTLAYLYTGRDVEALELLKKTQHLHPLNYHRGLWLHHTIKGELDLAQKEVAALEGIEPSGSSHSCARATWPGLREIRATAEAMISALEVTHKKRLRKVIAGRLHLLRPGRLGHLLRVHARIS